MIIKECNRCKKLIEYPNTYCDECKAIVERERGEKRRAAVGKANKRYNRSRDTKYTKFYKGREWRLMAGAYASSKGYRCEKCGAIATEVHHKEPIQTPNGWKRRLDMNNLMLLCIKCHNEEHNRFISKK